MISYRFLMNITQFNHFLRHISHYHPLHLEFINFLLKNAQKILMIIFYYFNASFINNFLQTNLVFYFVNKNNYPYLFFSFLILDSGNFLFNQSHHFLKLKY